MNEFRYTTGLRRYRSTLITTGSFTFVEGCQALTGGVIPAAQVPYWLGSGPRPGPRQRYVRVTPYGEGADNSTFDYRAWLFNSMIDDSNQMVGYQLDLLGFGTATLGTKLGAAGTLVDASLRFADTLTFTVATSATVPRGSGQELINAFGAVSPRVYSPVNNETAELIIGETGGADGLLLEVDLTGATGAGFLMQPGV